MTRRLRAFAFAFALSPAFISPAAAQDIVLRAAAFKNVHGNWSLGSDDTAADGHYLGSNDNGLSSTAAPLAQPGDYFEATFDAPAGTSYHVWFRLRASADSKSNDSVWVQYSDALTPEGDAVYRIGTPEALAVNLERCNACGLSGWGWQDGVYWLSQATTIQFAATGSQTIRVQAREDGVEIDQVVLSKEAYLFESPGDMTDDTVVVPAPDADRTASAGDPAGTPVATATAPRGASTMATASAASVPGTTTTATAMTAAGTTTTAMTAATTTATVAATAGPYLGSPVSLPGHIRAEDFDIGGDGVSYHDSTSGNTGGAYRQTSVDIQPCATGGYNVGWIAAGEWLNYTVKTAGGGAYTVHFRVASPSGGGSLHVGFNGPSNVWKTVSVPATGGWQNWTTVSVPVTLGAGLQKMTLLFDTPGFNLDSIDVSSGATTTPATGGASVSVVTWNVHVNSSAAHAQRAIDYVMTMTPQPQVVVLQEVRQSLYNTYINQLQARSGRTWRGVFRSHCPPGAWNGSSCTSSEEEGVAVFSSLPIFDSGTAFLPGADQWHSARGVARLAVSVGGVATQVMSVHLPVTASARATAMSALKTYAGRYSAPRLAAGDFNADMDQIDPGMSPSFVDSWRQVGSGRGLTAMTPSPTMKLDYWLQDAGGRARPAWSVVVTTPGTFSDHYPIINSYSIR